MFVMPHSSAKYLELRFNKVTRLLGTTLFIIQTVSKKSVNASQLGFYCNSEDKSDSLRLIMCFYVCHRSSTLESSFMVQL